MNKLVKVLFIIIVVIIFSSNVYAEELNCSKYLKRGSVGEDVKLLQSTFNNADICSLEEDGMFGPITKSCVIKFQEKYGLEKDGIVGPKTCSKLNQVIEEINNNKYVVVSANVLNVRDGAGTNNNIIDKVNLGELFLVYKTVKVNGSTWYKIKVDNKYGYVSGKYAIGDVILLDIKKQQLSFYKNGKIFMKTDVVTGVKGRHDTPVGHYTINPKNKVKGRTLRGYNDDGTKYASYVDYWMPFNGGIGFHDASWRKNFGGNIYKSNGSHGCVNMPISMASKLYNNITSVTDVIVK